MTSLDAVRVLNMILSAGCLTFWLVNMNGYWEGWGRRERVVSSAVASLLASLAYLSGSAASDAIPPTARAALLAAPLAFLLAALAWDRHSDKKERVK